LLLHTQQKITIRGDNDTMFIVITRPTLVKLMQKLQQAQLQMVWYTRV